MVSSGEVLNQALKHHQAGRLVEADTLYRQILSMEPLNAEVLHLKGVLALQSGEIDQAIDMIQQAIALAPGHVRFYQNLGNSFSQAERWDEALETYQKAIELDPTVAESHYFLGLCHQQQGQLAEAIPAYRQTVALKDDHAKAYFGLGLALLDSKQFEESIRELNNALICDPQSPFTLNSLGNAHQELEQWEQAEELYLQALRLDDRCADSYYNLGVVYQKVSQTPQAIEFYLQAIERNPTFFEAHRNLGTAYHEVNQLEEAEKHYKLAVEYKPECFITLNNLGNALYDQGRYPEALPFYNQALALYPENQFWVLRNQALCPIIPQSQAEIDDFRTRLHNSIGQINRHPGFINLLENNAELTLDTIPSLAYEPSFYLPYQGENELTVKSAFGDFYQKVFTLRFPEWVTPAPVSTHERFRIGFLVTDKHEGIFCKLMMGLLNTLQSDQLEAVIVCSEKSAHYIRPWIQNDAITLLEMSSSFQQTVTQVKGSGLDVLWYFEVGTDPVNYFLPYFNLAPVQCTSWGVPVTTGIAAMDYFISSHLLETQEAEAHYREQLVRLDHLPVYFPRPELPEPLETRESFGLSANGPLYLCPQNLFKIHPEFDEILNGILAGNPHGEIAFIAGRPHWTRLLQQRFDRTIQAEHRHRIRFIPRLNNQQFLSLVSLADVMLDPIHYSGGTTSLEGLAFGIPIITLPAPYMRGRITVGCYQVMDILDCVVENNQQYIDLALRLGKDTAFRENIRERILSKNHLLYGNPEAVTEMEALLLKLGQEARGKRDDIAREYP